MSSAWSRPARPPASGVRQKRGASFRPKSTATVVNRLPARVVLPPGGSVGAGPAVRGDLPVRDQPQGGRGGEVHRLLELISGQRRAVDWVLWIARSLQLGGPLPVEGMDLRFLVDTQH